MSWSIEIKIFYWCLIYASIIWVFNVHINRTTNANLIIVFERISVIFLNNSVWFCDCSNKFRIVGSVLRFCCTRVLSLLSDVDKVSLNNRSRIWLTSWPSSSFVSDYKSSSLLLIDSLNSRMSVSNGSRFFWLYACKFRLFSIVKRSIQWNWINTIKIEYYLQRFDCGLALIYSISVINFSNISSKSLGGKKSYTV